VPFAHPRLQPVIAPAIDHPLGRDAGEPRVRDRVFAETQFPGRMRIAVECKQASGRQGAVRKQVVDVLPVPVAVELDGDTVLCGLLEDELPIGRHTGATVEHAPSRMAQDRHPRPLHRVHHPRRLVLFSAKQRMWRRDDELEHDTLVRLHVQTAVRQDVGLDPLEDAERPRVLCVQPVDLGPLSRRLLHRDPSPLETTPGAAAAWSASAITE
jgi:hypothetical protein